MFTKEEITYLKELYRKIFGENANNSKEFSNFVQGYPNSLRIKVEEELAIVNNRIMQEASVTRRTLLDEAILKKLIDKRDLLKELDLFITNYIENYYV